MFTVWVLSLVALAALALAGWRAADHRADLSEMNRLLSLQPADPPGFDPATVADLPEPARRFFLFSIKEGTPLYRVAMIDLEGRFSLGTKHAPNYMDMTATQVLAAPEGFVWKMSGGSGLMRMSGSDAATWTRFWLAGLVPVARFGGNPDHMRSAFGRYVAEAVFWTPAALLPGPGITWETVDKDTARVTVAHGCLKQSVDVTLRADGSPSRVLFPRWTNANPEKMYRIQPFGGFLSEFRDFQGFRVPTHVEAGNLFGTDEYFPFFVIDVTEIRFAASGPAD